MTLDEADRATPGGDTPPPDEVLSHGPGRRGGDRSVDSARADPPMTTSPAGEPTREKSGIPKNPGGAISG